MSEIVLAIVGGLFLVAGAFLAYLGTRGKTTADAKAAADARIDGRMDAELARIYGRLDVAEATIAEQATALTDALKRLDEAHDRLDTAEATILLGSRQQVEMIQHIVHLEALIPNPPGPPVRPNWKLPILDGKGSQ